MFLRKEFSLTGPFRMAAVGCLFKGGLEGDSSESNSTTSNTTTTQDNKVVAGDKSFVVTAGAQVGDVTVESLDADLAKTALDNMLANSRANLDAATKGLGSVLDYASANDKRAFDFATDSQDRSFDFAYDVQDKAADNTKAILESSDANINRVTEAFKAAASGSSAQLQDNVTKITLAGIGAVALGVGAYVYLKAKK